MQANCAVGEPITRDAMRACYAKQVALVHDLLGDDLDAVRHWFATGMLGNVVAALELADVDEGWAEILRG